ITYDPSNQSLWIAEHEDPLGTDYGDLFDFALDGTVLRFLRGVVGGIPTCLALDPADNTLWMGSREQLGTFYQYTREGSFRGSVTYPELTDQNTLGGEFAFFIPAAVPEPSTLTLLGLGIAGSVGFGWRRARFAPSRC